MRGKPAPQPGSRQKLVALTKDELALTVRCPLLLHYPISSLFFFPLPSIFFFIFFRPFIILKILFLFISCTPLAVDKRLWLHHPDHPARIAIGSLLQQHFS
jgi:hypothetical protein